MTRHALSYLIACAVIIGVMSAGLSSCSKDEYTSRLRELIIYDFEFDASAGSQTQTFRKENLTNYTASSSQKWCVATMNSSGLTVTVTANDTYDERIDSVTLKDKVSGTTRKIEVSQEAKEAVIVSKATYDVEATGGKVSIMVKHNTDFAIKMPDADWITLTKPAKTRALDSTAVELTVAKNNSGGVRSATLSIINTETDEANQITINQAFTPVFTLNTTALTINEIGGELKMLVKANIPLTVTTEAKWLKDAGEEEATATVKEDKEDEDEGEEELYYWKKVKVEPFTEKKGNRTATVTFSNLTYDIFKQVTVTQNRPLFIQAVSINLTAGDTYDLQLVNTENAAVVWQSSNADVATVNAVGKVTAKSAGTATIRVTSSDSIHSDSVKVNVEAAAFKPEFTATPTALTIDENGGELQVLVKSNVDTEVAYSNKWLKNGGITPGVGLYHYQKIKVDTFTEKSASRTATVTFTNLAYEINQQVTVTQNRPLFIKAVTAKLKVGDTYEVPLNNTQGLVVTWKSSNPTAATVDAAGTVTAKKAGTAVITVTSADGSHTDTVSLTVEEGEIKPEFSLNPEALTIDENGGELKVLVKTNVAISTSYSESWISSGGSTKMSEEYYWQKIKVGAFTQKSASRTATVSFTNFEHDINKQLTITQNRPLFIKAISTTLAVGGTYEAPLHNPESLVVAWESSDTSVATVDGNGKVTAKGAGTAKISVTSSGGKHTDSITVTVEGADDASPDDEA